MRTVKDAGPYGGPTGNAIKTATFYGIVFSEDMCIGKNIRF